MECSVSPMESGNIQGEPVEVADELVYALD